MNALDFTNAPASRPKVHRLPKRTPETRRHRLSAVVMNYGNAAKLVFTLSSITLAAVLSVLVVDRLFPGTLHQGMMVESSASAVAPISDVMAASLPVSAQTKTIILKEENDSIVGQMAKIIPSAPAADISASTIDKSKGRELLSIVNKY